VLRLLKIPQGKILKATSILIIRIKRSLVGFHDVLKTNPKPCPHTENRIEISEGLDSKIERFLAEEYPYSYGLCPDRPYDYVTNLPPCLKENPDFPGIKLRDEPTCQMDDSPVVNTINANTQSLQPHCNEC
jgi:hypothetical protein